MTFLNPWAWLGVLAIAAPVLAHLLARRPARHLPFPNLRFLPATTPSPVRRDRLSDLWLLVLRAAIIASAAFALAQPLWLSNERARSLGVQIARAVIVDSSASMSRSSGNDGPAIDVARRLAQTTADDATTARVAEHFAPASAIQSAVTWLLTQPMRRELTIVSDFQTSTISRADLDRIPAAIGLRMIKVAAAGPVVEDRDATRELVLLTNAAGRDSAIAARSAAIAQGAPAQIRADRPVAIVFPGFETRPALLDRAQPLDAGWMFDVFSAVTEDPIVAAAAARLEHSPLDLLRVAREPASEHASLLVIADTPPNSLFAAAVIGSVLRAAAPQPPAGEVTATIYAADVLQGWERSPASVERADSARARLWSDARWAWLATVILLLLESLARRRRTRPQVETHARVRPEARTVRDVLRRARRRARTLRMLRASAWAGAAAAVVIAIAGTAVSIGVALGLIVAFAGVAAVAAMWSQPGSLEVAGLIERRTPASRNLVLTASEIIEGRVAAAPEIAARVFRDTNQVLAGVALNRILPASSTVAGALVAVALIGVAVVARHGGTPARVTPVSATAATVRSVSVEVVAPDYARRPLLQVRNPERIEALAGSRLRVTVSAEADRVRVETVTGSVVMQSDGRGGYSTDLGADADGYLAVVPVATTGLEGARRLIGLSVTQDRAPRVRVLAPSRDMVLPDGQRTLAITIDADDDLGLATLRLKFTRISGSGENFTFTEGEVPLALSQSSDRAWSARGQWALGPLRLEPGDMVVYRGVATDARPGSPPAESDAFIAEVAAPGATGADGFAIDDHEDRYALSQQMVIVKTERLLARRASMAPDDAREATLDLAAEQRQVRAEFVFMMGGELADAGIDLSSLNEEVEAAGEEDLAAGRLANQGRLDILRAIRSMSRAAARLTDIDPAAALPVEKEALAYLQRAFSKSRYILRTLGARERIDLSRRLTGVLAALGRDGRAAAAAAPSSRADELRRILSALAGLSDSGLASPDAAARVSQLAQRTLQIDPASQPFREAAAKLGALATAITGRRGADASRALRDDVATALAALVRRELPAGAGPSAPAALADLAGALSDALRSVKQR